MSDQRTGEERVMDAVWGRLEAPREDTPATAAADLIEAARAVVEGADPVPGSKLEHVWKVDPDDLRALIDAAPPARRAITVEQLAEALMAAGFNPNRWKVEGPNGPYLYAHSRSFSDAITDLNAALDRAAAGDETHE